jgi:hypothetical protein
MATIDGNYYTRRKAITISHTHVGSTLANFLLCVQITADTDIGAVCQSTGNDLRFTDADGMLLAAEKESFSVSSGAATGVFWVNVPTVSSTADTTVYCYYGNALASAQTSSTGVWDSNFAGVWHLNDAGSSTIQDSTINANNGTNNSVTAATGQIGGAGSFGGSSKIQTAATGLPTGNENVSLSAWIQPSSSSGAEMIFSYGTYPPGGEALYAYESVNTIRCGNGSTEFISAQTVQLNSWTHVVVTHTGSVTLIYINGVLDSNSGSFGFGTVLSGNVNIGADYWAGNYFNGLIDEVRVSSVARSADWITFEYWNQKDMAGQLTWNSQESCDSSNIYAVAMTCRGVSS